MILASRVPITEKILQRSRRHAVRSPSGRSSTRTFAACGDSTRAEDRRKERQVACGVTKSKEECPGKATGQTVCRLGFRQVGSAPRSYLVLKHYLRENSASVLSP